MNSFYVQAAWLVIGRYRHKDKDISEWLKGRRDAAHFLFLRGSPERRELVREIHNQRALIRQQKQEAA